MHASARYRNVTRTAMVYLLTLTLGAELVDAEDTVFDSATVSTFVRVRVDPSEESAAGHVAGDRASLVSVTLVAECYARNGDGADVAPLDRALGIAEAVADGLRARTLPLYDHVTTPGTPVAVSGTNVQFHQMPKVTRLPPADGWSRRIVTVEGWYVLRHSG